MGYDLNNRKVRYLNGQNICDVIYTIYDILYAIYE